MQHSIVPLTQFESALPSLTKVHAAPSHAEKNESAEVAVSLDRRGFAQAPFEKPCYND